MRLLLVFIVYIIVSYILLELIKFITNKLSNIKIKESKISIKKYVIISFIIIWIVNFVVFLNMYPSTLSCDTPGQLREAVTMSDYENLNPLINTLVLTVFVQIGMAIKDVSLGCALYTLFQLTFYSFTGAYTLYVLAKIKNTKYVRWLGTLFFIWPMNVIYATGMWKDTFFAICLLLCFAKMLELLTCKDKVSKKQIIVFSLTVILASLARNSGWSALLVECLFLFIYSRKVKDPIMKYNYKKVVYTEIISCLIAIFIMSVIYPLCGIPSTHSSIAVSIPMQQIARVVFEGNYTSEEYEMICNILKNKESFDLIPTSYSSSLVDPLRGLFDSSKLNTSEFFSTWLKLGSNHLKEYFYAWSDHTSNFWWYKDSSWHFDNRVFDNDYGVVRQAIIMPSKDVAAGFYRLFVNNLPILDYLNNSGFTLYVFILCAYLCSEKKNVGWTLCMPFLLMYVAMCMFCFAGLFRYTYQAVLCMPLVWGFYFLSSDKDINND